MTLKNLMTVAAVAALTASSALAQPTATLDLVRDGSGIAQLSADGNWQFVITVTQGDIVDLDGELDGDSLALFGALSLTDSPLITGSVETSGQADGLPLTNDTGVFNDTDLFDTLIPAPVFFSFADPLTNGSVTGAGTGGAFPLGIVEGQDGTDLSNVNFGIGSDEVGGAAGSTPQAVEALFFEVEGPSTTGSLTTTVAAALQVAQAVVGTPSSVITDLGTLNFSTTVIAGDADLDGDVDFSDFLALSPNFNNPGTFIWTQGDFDGDGDVDFSDFLALSPNFNNFAGNPAPVVSGSAVPEPSTLLLAASLVAIAMNRRSRD